MKQILAVYEVENGFVVDCEDFSAEPGDEKASTYFEDIDGVQNEIDNYLGYFYGSDDLDDVEDTTERKH